MTTLSFAPDARNWLEDSHNPRILHVFDRACNLINERREVLSIVAPQIGNGPFNLVVEDGICFSEYLNLQCPIGVSTNQLSLGDLIITTTKAKLWSPHPNWEMLHANRKSILTQLFCVPINDSQPLLPYSLVSNLTSALATADISAAQKSTAKLAGLGAGLTPAGDDFLLGAIHAAWIIHPPEVAGMLAQGIAGTAAPMTTSLSAAWLRAAARGEAGALWHEFFNAVLTVNSSTIQFQIAKLISVGHTSGADAFAGFLGSFMCWAKSASGT